jgi:hypothetical protein
MTIYLKDYWWEQNKGEEVAVKLYSVIARIIGNGCPSR